MKMLKLLLILACCAFSYNASEADKHETGVWVNDKAELLLTNKIMIYFEKSCDNEVMAMVKVDSLAEDYCLFMSDTILRGNIPSNFMINHLNSGDVLVNGEIYWSYTSHSPHQIILKGCGGDTYYIKHRKASDNNLFEWIKYR